MNRPRFQTLQGRSSESRVVVVGHGDVLHGVVPTFGGRTAEIERPEVNGLVRIIALPVECDAHKALRLNIPAAHIRLDGAVAEVRAFDPNQPRTRRVIHAHSIAGSQRGGLAVDGPEAAGASARPWPVSVICHVFEAKAPSKTSRC
jgi:hypothetical protein